MSNAHSVGLLSYIKTLMGWFRVWRKKKSSWKTFSYTIYMEISIIAK